MGNAATSVPSIVSREHGVGAPGATVNLLGWRAASGQCWSWSGDAQPESGPGSQSP